MTYPGPPSRRALAGLLLIGAVAITIVLASSEARPDLPAAVGEPSLPDRSTAAAERDAELSPGRTRTERANASSLVDVAAVPTAGVVSFSGRIATVDGGTLASATLIAWPPARSRSTWASAQRFATDLDGRFSGTLDKSVFRYDQVAVDVHDGTGFVFRGLVRTGDDIVILVDASPDPADVLSGRIVLPQARPDDAWIAFLYDVEGNPLANSGVRGPCLGKSADVILRLAPWDRSTGDEVALAAFLTTGRHRRGVIGVRKFENLARLKAELAVGVVIDSVMRRLRVADIGGRRPTSLGFRTPDKSMSFLPWNPAGNDDEARDFDEREIALPAGEYFVKGYNEVGGYGVATVRVEDESEIEVAWEIEGPGSGRILVSAEDLPGGGAERLLTWYREATDGISLLYGDLALAPTPPTTIEGLVAGRYRVQAWADGLLVADGGFVEVVDRQDRTCRLEPVTGRNRGSAFLEFINLHELGLDAIDFGRVKVWYRATAEQPWRLIDVQRDAAHGGIIAGLWHDSPAHFAVAGAWWYGTGQAMLGDETSLVRIRTEPALVLEGRIVSKGGAGPFNVRWVPANGVSAQYPPPWTQALTASRFRLLAIGDGTVRVERGGEVVCTVPVGDFSQGELDIVLD